MPEEGKAEAVLNVQTDELAQQPTEPSVDDVSAEATGDASLDYDELLPKKDPNNKRGGLSRKEARLQKDESEDEPEPEDDKIEALLREVADLKHAVAGTNSRKAAEQEFDQALNRSGVDASTFNTQYKSEYLEERDSLIEDGISPEKASKLALKVVLPKAQAEDIENRSNGRIRATLPPTGKTQSKTVYKESEIMKLLSTDKAQYKDLMNKRDRGEITVV